MKEITVPHIFQNAREDPAAVKIKNHKKSFLSLRKRKSDACSKGCDVHQYKTNIKCVSIPGGPITVIPNSRRGTLITGTRTGERVDEEMQPGVRTNKRIPHG